MAVATRTTELMNICDVIVTVCQPVDCVKLTGALFQASLVA